MTIVLACALMVATIEIYHVNLFKLLTIIVLWCH
nr:MAG TPA: protein of unknown function DUF2149 [Bacteriophage sp.]